MNLNPISKSGKGAVKLFATFGLGLLVLSLLASNLQAQERGFQPGAAYAISDVEAINTENGNVILRVPLGSLPAGRGGIPGPRVNLVYNSKLYASHTETIPDPSTGQPTNYIFLNDSDLGGWRYDFSSGYDIDLTSRTNIE